MNARVARGGVPSPNIWNHPQVYERENAALDPDGLIDAALRELRPWAGATILDIGCGTGYHLPRLAAEARRVVGVEPHDGLAAIARRRTRALAGVTVARGSAQALPLPDRSVDLAHARWAYFFGPGCEPGLRELERVARSGATACLVDTDPTRSTFGRWFGEANPGRDPDRVEAFFARRGWRSTRLLTRMVFASRADVEAVLRIEFPPEVATAALDEHAGLEIDHAVVIRVRDY